MNVLIKMTYALYNKYKMNKLITPCYKYKMDEFIEICSEYKNVTKYEMKNLNIYAKNDFLNFNEYNTSALFNCCLNNNLLGPKYFVKRHGITKDEIMICNEQNETCLHFVCHNKQLSATKYLINTYNLTKNDFMKKNIFKNNCLHFFFHIKKIIKYVYIFLINMILRQMTC